MPENPKNTPDGGKLLVALSGGVDSAVAAFLLKREGYAVAGAYMRTWMNEEDADIFGDCAWEEDIRQARAVAAHLGIDFEVVNLIDEYRKKVVAYMVEGYRAGTTPNPDIMCNREMKFGVFRDYAQREGFGAVATGHYCRRVVDAGGTAAVHEGCDKNKDQSYFLAMVTGGQVRDARFPVGELEKPRVRELARKAGLPNAERKDSQGICFLGKVDIRAFLRQYIPDSPGEIVNAAGTVVGEHRGLHHYTIGQRKGIGVPSNADFEKYVVVGKELETNRLRVAFERPEAPSLYTREARIRGLSFINEPVNEPCLLLARPRYRDPAQAIHFEPDGEGRATVTFEDPQRALAGGQVIALYRGERLLGGGFFE